MPLNLEKITNRTYTGAEDLPSIAELTRICEVADRQGLGFSVERLQNVLSRPEQETPHLWEDADGTLVGMIGLRILTVELDNGPSLEARLLHFAHPEARSGNLETEMLDWAATRLKEVAREKNLPAALVKWVGTDQSHSIAVLEKHDFKVTRYFFVMSYSAEQLPPAPHLPDGFIMRANAHADVNAWVEVYNQSFVDHYHFHPTTPEIVKHDLAQPGYSAERDLVAVAPDGRYAAFCFCRLADRESSAEGQVEGWVDLVGTRRSFRSLGLGKAVLLAGMRQLIEDGAEVVRLIVDADSLTGATRLYESVGFQKYRTYTEYSKSV